MPLQNRVTPFGEIVAEPWRGSLTGNRGCLHNAERRLGTARWRSALWIACLTEFRGRRRDPMPPREWTALFFWDEACAFAAGHRPCAYCRREDYRRFRRAWDAAGLPGKRAVEMDRVLHAARLTPGREKRLYRAEASSLPPGTMIAVAGEPVLIAGDGALVWNAGYRPTPMPRGNIEVLTPAPLVAVLANGYRPAMRL